MTRAGTICVSRGDVEKLTHHQRNMLVDHIDGELDVNCRDPHLVGVRNSLIRISMLKGATSNTSRPRATVLTERGRMAVGLVLGNYADALVRAGLLEQVDPLEALRELKARSGPSGPVPGKGALQKRNL